MKKYLPDFIAKPLCAMLILSFVFIDFSPQSAQAGMISTETILSAQATTAARDRVQAFLARDDVRQAISAQGVAPEEVARRVASLTDDEVNRIAADIDNLPAGAGVGTIVGAAVFVFVLLLVTDILGLTKVFPFTRPIR